MDSGRLEQYLFDLEKNLADFPPSKKAEIVLENHRHILEAREKYPDKNLKEILDDLGPAQKVANHYRLDSGLKTFKPKTKHPVLKWFSITVLGSFAILFIFLGAVVYKFTPLASVDEDEGRITLLGGLIDINETSGKIKVFDQYKFVDNRYTNQFEGAFELTPDMNEVVVHFDSGIVNFKTSLDKRASWKCKLQNPPGKNIVSVLPRALEIDLAPYGGGSCDIEVPVDATLTATGRDAQVNVYEPEYDLMVEFENGALNFAPNPEVDYNYDIRIENGRSDEFSSSQRANAYEVKLYLENGDVRKVNGP